MSPQDKILCRPEERSSERVSKDGYCARILLDSISELGIRLTTMEVTFPRFVLSEMNTHRMLSKNSSSSRAIPTAKLIQRAEENPVFPFEWGKNKAGMSASEVITDIEAAEAHRLWLEARDAAVEKARQLQKLNIHKQVVNRILEPFLWHTVLISGTEWENFFSLRCSENAQPEIHQAAIRMRQVMSNSKPQLKQSGEWHLPLIQDDERQLDIEILKKVSSARCARVSYLTHDGARDIQKDLDLYERLKADRHLSPFEHVATPAADTNFHANFRGWIQLRASLE